MTVVDRYLEGQLVGRYRIVRLIGEGGMGEVYEALHPGLKKRVAVKVLLPRIAESQEARVRFLREGEAASRINHPNVVSVFDVGEDAGAPYLVMEYLEGRTLGDFLAERGALDVADAAALFLPIVAAVSAGHECGVVHRDLKPQNIFLAQGRWGEVVPKVLDFGVSKLTDHDGPPVTRTETVLGTACYMSPEQARGARHVEARSDQFTLGLILYEMLTGRRAYRGQNDLELLYNAALASIQPANEVRAGLPDQLCALLTRMLALSPADRYPSLRDAARVLLPLASENTRVAVARDFDTLVLAASDAGAAEPTGGEAPCFGVVDDVQGQAQAAVEAVAPMGSSGTAAYPLTDDRRQDTTEDTTEDTTLRHAAIQATARELARARLTRPATKRGVAIGTAVVAVGAMLAWKAAPAPRPLDSPGPPRPSAPVAPVQAAATPAATSTAQHDEPADRAAPFEVSAFPPDAEIVLDGRQPLRGRLRIVLPLAGSSHEIRVSAPGYASKTISFGGDQPPPPEIRLDRVVAPPQPAGAKDATRARRPRKVASAPRGTNDAMIIK